MRPLSALAFALVATRLGAQTATVSPAEQDHQHMMRQLGVRARDPLHTAPRYAELVRDLPGGAPRRL